MTFFQFQVTPITNKKAYLIFELHNNNKTPRTYFKAKIKRGKKYLIPIHTQQKQLINWLLPVTLLLEEKVKRKKKREK